MEPVQFRPDAVCDGGDLDAGSGLLMLIRGALEQLPEGGILEVRSREPSVAHDLPAWCRITGHPLCGIASGQDHTKYFVQRGGLRGVIASETPDWGIRVPLRGGKELDTRDWFVGRMGQVPETAPPEAGFAPRGAVVEAGSPAFPFSINEKEKVWAENVAELYEQATANQWDASKDIPWHLLEPLPDDLERAVCQVMTFLVENEYSALYVPAQFVSRINPQYSEVVMFLSTQMVDEARHIEAFTKRALANGGGLQYSAASTQLSLKTLFDQRDFSSASFLLSVLGEGTFLDLLKFIEDYAPDPVTREIVSRARVDESRHVHFGMAHIKHYIGQDPAHAKHLIRAVKERAGFLRAVTGVNPLVQEALTVLAAGGLDPKRLPLGIERVKQLYSTMHENRVKRLVGIGFSREEAESMSVLHTPNFM